MLKTLGGPATRLPSPDTGTIALGCQSEMVRGSRLLAVVVCRKEGGEVPKSCWRYHTHDILGSSVDATVAARQRVCISHATNVEGVTSMGSEHTSVQLSLSRPAGADDSWGIPG